MPLRRIAVALALAVAPFPLAVLAVVAGIGLGNTMVAVHNPGPLYDLNFNPGFAEVQYSAMTSFGALLIAKLSATAILLLMALVAVVVLVLRFAPRESRAAASAEVADNLGCSDETDWQSTRPRWSAWELLTALLMRALAIEPRQHDARGKHGAQLSFPF